MAFCFAAACVPCQASTLTDEKVGEALPGQDAPAAAEAAAADLEAMDVSTAMETEKALTGSSDFRCFKPAGLLLSRRFVWV